jgi:hypothetical protein
MIYSATRANSASGGRQIIAFAPVKEYAPAANGITTASPLVIAIVGAFAKVISPLPSKTKAMAKPAGRSPLPGAK